MDYGQVLQVIMIIWKMLMRRPNKIINKYFFFSRNSLILEPLDLISF